MEKVNDLTAILSLNFSPFTKHGWIPQNYWSNGEYVIVYMRGGWLCGLNIEVYSMSGKSIYILNSWKELETLVNRNIKTS